MSELRLGGFARMFPPGPVEELARQFAALGLGSMQLNLSALGLPTIASELPEGLRGEVRAALGGAGIELWGISATYNMAGPDAARRAMQTHAAAAFIGLVAGLGAQAVTVCTGTRDADDMWRAHPDNAGEAAWRDMRASLDCLLEAASAAGMQVGVEPEGGNVVATTQAAQRLLRELGGDADLVTIIIDPANLLAGRMGEHQHEVLAEAFGELGDHVGCVHAKDCAGWHAALAGCGVVDFPLVLRLREKITPAVPVIIQDATPAQLPGVIELLRRSA